MKRFQVFHQAQPSGDYVATCEALPGWFVFGDTLDESQERAEWSVRDHLLGGIHLRHFEIPLVNHTLPAAA